MAFRAKRDSIFITTDVDLYSGNHRGSRKTIDQRCKGAYQTNAHNAEPGEWYVKYLYFYLAITG